MKDSVINPLVRGCLFATVRGDNHRLFSPVEEKPHGLLPAWFWRDAQAAAIGTLASAVGAVAVLPLTHELIHRQTDLTRTSSDAIKTITNKKTPKKLWRAIPLSVSHAGLRSLTTLGVANVVLHRLSNEDSQAKKGFVAGVFAGISQALLTTPVSHFLFRSLVDKEGLALRAVLRHRRLWVRMYGIALIKNPLDQGLALMVAYWMKQYLSETNAVPSGPMQSFVSGVSGAACASFLSMPLVNAESNILVYPWRSVMQWRRQVAAKKDPRLYWRGGVLRTARVMVSLGVGLTIKDEIESRYLGRSL